MINKKVINIFLQLIISVNLVIGGRCPEVCFCKASDLSVSCQEAELNELPEGIRPETIKLDLSFNKFLSIPKGISQLNRIEFLDMSYNQILYLNQSSLVGLNNLTVLDLSYNNFTNWLNIDYNALTSVPSLLELDLSYNNFGSLELMNNYTLRSLSVKKLSLNNCSLTSFASDFFSGLPELEILLLSKNPFVTLNIEMKSEKLKILDLSECSLHKIFPTVFMQLTSLEELRLSKNYFLKRFNCASSSLKYLDVSHCNLEALPNGRLHNLLKANFQGNFLRYIPPHAFKVAPILQELILSNNAIKSIDLMAFTDLPLIEHIDLSVNTIAHLPSEIFLLNKKLQILNLSRNYLSDIGQLVIDSLKWLDLSVCEIREIRKDSLIMMPNLERLNLSRNSMITRIPNRLQGDKLNMLDLRMCGIFALNNLTFASLHNLRVLNLAENRLTSGIKPSCFYGIINVNLESNPWLCECDSKEFKELYDWLTNTMASRFTLRCRSPENLAGLRWENACYNSWNVIEKSMPHQMWIYSMSLVLVMTFFCFVVISIRQFHQRKLNRQREAEDEEREEARQRLRQMHLNMHRSVESINRNAPDPREEQSPPTYVEAISMPRLNMSCASLAGSRRSLYSIQSTTSQPEASRRSKVRRKKRKHRKRSKNDIITESQSAVSLSRINTDLSSSNEELRAERGNLTESNL